MNAEMLTDYLREAEHHPDQPRAEMPEHHWSQWYSLTSMRAGKA